MSLRQKIIFIFGLTFLGLIVLAILGMQSYLLDKIADFEKHDVYANTERIVHTLNNEVKHLDSLLNDWADWDDTYNYIVDRNAHYIASNLTDATYRQLKLSLVIYLNNTGQTVYERSFDSRAGRQQPVSAQLRQLVLAKQLLAQAKSAKNGIQGLLNSQYGLMLIGYHPILTSNAKGPARGLLIMGRYLDAVQIKELSKQANLPIALVPYPKYRQWLNTYRLRNPGAVNHESIAVHPKNETLIEGYAVLNDLFGQPVAAIRTEMPRTLYRQGKTSIFYFSVVLCVTGIFLTCLMVVFLQRSVLSRLDFFNERIHQIAASSDLSIRIPVAEDDEIAQYAKVFNSMMNSVEDSRAELEKSKEELATLNRTLTDVIEFLPDPTFIIDQTGKVVSWNRAIEELTGVDKIQVIGKGNEAYAIPFWGEPRPLLINMVYADWNTIQIYYDNVAKTGTTLRAEVFVTSLGNGQGAHLLANASPLTDQNGRPIGAIETIHDITNRKKAEEQLRYLGWHDRLTGLYNRTYFDMELSRYEHGEYSCLGLVICDVDGLKPINDSRGHAMGDKLLQVAAGVLNEATRATQTVARIGGDEFAILIPDATPEESERVCERITRLSERYNEGASDFKLSISVGWAIAAGHKTIKEVLDEADNNMYREKLHRSQSFHNSVIQILVKTLAARDYITEGHSERMKKLVATLGEKLGMPGQKVNDLKLLAEIHDIGKIGISDTILFKPGHLDEAERSEIQRHSQIGYIIAQSAQELFYISDWILKHHEWWDGSGYPLGLKGDSIPLECRIIAIADAYDAMTNDRPYRKALSKAAAVIELRKGAGTQFDPALVELFIELVLNASNHGEYLD